MPMLTRTQLQDLRGVARLGFEATAGIVQLVEAMHGTIQQRPAPFGVAPADSTRGLTGLVYRSVESSVRLLGKGMDAALSPVDALLPEGETTPGREAYVAAINGAYGDYLVRTGNPLALPMELRHRGQRVDATDPAASLQSAGLDTPSSKVMLLVHGLCMTDHQWTRDGHDHGAALARDLGYTPLYLRYNSGLHIADNGQLLGATLETLLASWPVQVEELTLLGHSMGGLVVRSAVHQALESGQDWPRALRHMAFLGTPHHGALLERGGHGLDFVLQLSPYSAPFTRMGKVRSAGIRDLRHGTVTSGEHRFVQLPPHVRSYAIAGLLAGSRPTAADRVVGDGLVSQASALGKHVDAGRTLSIPRDHQWTAPAVGHLDLLGSADVYERLAAWLRTSAQRDIQRATTQPARPAINKSTQP
jgi:pimeloyl-ACP methyl ester carboxylesterase